MEVNAFKGIRGLIKNYSHTHKRMEVDDKNFFKIIQ